MNRYKNFWLKMANIARSNADNNLSSTLGKENEHTLLIVIRTANLYILAAYCLTRYIKAS
jgi:hypothetical protein